jgi:hypothetical protein
VIRGRDTRDTCDTAGLLRGVVAGQGYASAVPLDPDHVSALRSEGHSFRAIAATLGASLGAVQRAVKRRDRLDAELTELLDDDGCALTPPLTFCGIDFTDDPHGTERVIDALGRQADALRRYRWYWHHDGDDRDGLPSWLEAP